MSERLRNWIKNKFDLYDIEDLSIGGHCGCCGDWIKDRIIPITLLGAISLCEICSKE